MSLARLKELDLAVSDFEEPADEMREPCRKEECWKALEWLMPTWRLEEVWATKIHLVLVEILRMMRVRI